MDLDYRHIVSEATKSAADIETGMVKLLGITQEMKATSTSIPYTSFIMRSKSICLGTSRRIMKKYSLPITCPSFERKNHRHHDVIINVSFERSSSSE
jgi:hypothetical protein